MSVTASQLVPVSQLSQQDRDRQDRDRGGVDIEVPVPEADPAPVPQPSAEPFDGLPRTGLELALVWAAGVALLSGGLALRALTRRRPSSDLAPGAASDSAAA